MSCLRFVASWATKDQKVLLSFSGQALETFSAHVQDLPDTPEAGGVLLGTVHGNNLIVTEATKPTTLDKRVRYFFERLPFGHQEIANQRWRSSGGIVRYLGEWHTHPEDHPSPSGTDMQEWRILAERRSDGRPLLAVIVGLKNLHVELVPQRTAGIQLFSLY